MASSRFEGDGTRKPEGDVARRSQRGGQVGAAERFVGRRERPGVFRLFRCDGEYLKGEVIQLDDALRLKRAFSRLPKEDFGGFLRQRRQSEGVGRG